MPRLQNEFKLVSFTSEDLLASPSLFADLEQFCLISEADPSPMAHNYHQQNWQTSPHTLLYCLHTEQRFRRDSGCFYALYENQKIIAVSGIYRPSENPQFAIGGVRTYTLPSHRHRFWHGDFIFPQQLKWASDQNLDVFLLTFNEESRTLCEFIERIGRGQATVLGQPISETAKSFYSGFQRLPQKVRIKGVDQYVLYKKLNPLRSVDFKAWESNACAI